MSVALGLLLAGQGAILTNNLYGGLILCAVGILLIYLRGHLKFNRWYHRPR